MIIYVKISEKLNFFLLSKFYANFTLIYVQKVIYGRTAQNFSSKPHNK